jgi:hypothetical protein
MRRLEVSIIILLASAIPVVAQVDTLQLVEIGSIEAPGQITNLYVEDLDGDSLKEIILTTATNVHIYNGTTYEEIWTSPDLVNPGDLQFADMNDDGLLDAAAMDSIHVWLFDVANDAIIWSNPDLENPITCFTVGDRNSDEYADFAVLTTEYVDYPFPHDSIRVHIYDGPSYEPGGLILTTFPIGELIPDPPGWWWIEYTEKAAKLVIAEITGSSGLRPVIFLSTLVDAESSYLFIHWYYQSGNMSAFDGLDLSTSYQVGSGYMSFHETADADQGRVLHCLTRSTLVRDDLGIVWESAFSGLFSADTLEYSASLIDPHDQEWRGFTIGDIDYDNQGDEICYGNKDSLILVTSISADTIWQVAGPDDPFSVEFNYVAPSLFDNPLVICGYGRPVSEYQFFSGSDGSLIAVLSDFDYPISRVTDMDGDGNGEILSLDGADLYVYGLRRTAVEDEPPLPDRDSLVTNYPNPFNSTTTIEYGLPEAGHVRIEIYDLLGRKVETLVDQELEAGHHRVIWDAGEHTSGVYFYRVVAGDLSETKRMVLLK